MTPDKSRGRLELVHGSMFAGKTELLISRLRQEQMHGRRVLAVKHAMDDRYDAEHLVTHRHDRFDAVRAPNAKDILRHVADAEVVGIDEGHFFKIDLVPVVETLLCQGKLVIVAGITYDVWGRPFEPIPQLSEMADDVVQRCAPCRVCGDPAPYNQRTTPIDTLLMVGGLDDYEPRCRRHFTPLADPPEN